MTISDYQEILVELKKALIAAIGGASYTVSTPSMSRTFTRQNIKDLKELISFYESELSQEQNSSNGFNARFFA